MLTTLKSSLLCGLPRNSTCIRPLSTGRPRLMSKIEHRSSCSLVSKLQRLQTVGATAIDLSSLGLDVPDIDGDLKSVMTELGATFDDDGVPRTFNNARQAVDALSSGVVLLDRSHWARLRVTGKGALPLLQRLTTNNIQALKPGSGCDTLLLTPGGAALDLITVLVAGSFAMLLVHPAAVGAVMAALREAAATAEGEGVQVQDVSARCCMLTLLGPESDNILKELGGDSFALIGAQYGTHTLFKFRDAPVMVVVGCGLAAPGYTLIADESVAGELYSVLASKGCILMGEDEWECARIVDGRPAPVSELGEQYSPLEAGLYHAVSEGKGDFVGRAALLERHGELGRTERELWGIQAEAPVWPGDAITLNGVTAGAVTSSTTTPAGTHVALGYVAVRGAQAAPGAQAAEGTAVMVGSVPATLAAIPFASRTFLSELMGGLSVSGVGAAPGAMAMVKRAEEAREKALAEAAAAEAEKQAKLKEMQDRLASWQAQQLGTTGGL